MYHIIFRACDSVTAVNRNPRPFGLDKRTLIKACFASLEASAGEVPHRIHVVGDRLSDEMVDFFSRRDVTLTNRTLGNDESLRETFRLALSLPASDWVYFCEDDYLHRPETFRCIDGLLRNRDRFMEYRPRLRNLASLIELRTKDLFVHPADYPDRYRGKWRRFSLILHSGDSHWRQVTDTTFTFLTQVSTVAKHIGLLMRASRGANDRRLSRALYGRYLFMGKALCLSPIPGLASHMHVDTMTPLVDWKAVLDFWLSRVA